MCEELRLERYDNSPWGFRLTGGLDFGTPLSIIKVTGGSIAEECGVQAGDLVKFINGRPTTHFTHLDAQNCIASAGNYLTLTVLRGSVVTPPASPLRGLSPAPESIRSENMRYTPSPTIMKTDIEGEIMDYYNHKRATDVRDGSRSPVPVHQNTGQKASVTKQKYSVNDEGQLLLGDRALSDLEIAELLTSNEEVLDQGVLGINFKKFLPKVDFIRNSEVFKMLQNENTRKEISEQAQLQKEPTKRFSTFLMKPKGPQEQSKGLTFVKFKPPRYLPKRPDPKWELPRLKPWERPKRKDPEHSVLWLFLEEKGEDVIDERWGTDEEERVNLSRNSFIEYDHDRSSLSSSLRMHDDDTCSVTSKDHYDYDTHISKGTDSSYSKEQMHDGYVSKGITNPQIMEQVHEEEDISLYKGEQRLKTHSTKEGAGLRKLGKLEHTTDRYISKETEVNEELIHNKYESMKKEEDRRRMNEHIIKEKRQIQKFDDREKKICRTPKFIIEAKLECVESVQYDHEDIQSESVNLKEEYSSMEEMKHKKSISTKLVEQLTEIQGQIEALEYEAPTDLQMQLLAVKEQLSKIVQVKTNGGENSKVGHKSRKYDGQATHESKHNVSRSDTSIDESNMQRLLELQEDEGTMQQKLSSVTESEAYASSRNTSKRNESSSSCYESSRNASACYESSRNASACYESSRNTSAQHGTITERIEHVEEMSDVEVASFQVEQHEERGYQLCVAPSPKPQLKKKAHPITPQMRPIILPGGRMWRQPKDAEHEEFYQGILVAQAEVLVGSTEGLNYTKYMPPKVDMTTSEVYRLIHETEDGHIKSSFKEPDPNYCEPISKRHFYAATLREPAPIGVVELSEMDCS